MFMSTLIIAVGGFLVSAGQESHSWHTDYPLAQRVGRRVCKPLAVFIGSGKTGWNQLTPDGQLGAEVKQLLGKKYVCVYVDTATKTGKQVASEFEIPKGPGLIVGDHTGRYQVFHHQGNLLSEQLLRYLRRYADRKRVVQTTETNPAETASYFVPVEWYYQPIQYAPVSVGRISGSC
jgi:hypothetical protein